MTDQPGQPGHQRPPQVGDVIEHYRLEHVIGVGGMGQVFGAQDLRLGRAVALKVVLGQFAESEDFARRFQREASTLARLDSPHVISIYDHGEHQGLPFIVTQYAAGGDLGRRLRERGPMPTGLATRVCSQVADALAAAHGVGVVHRDVKPANVLLRDDRLDRMHVYLCDFGVALTDGGGMTSPGAVAGTWNYLAPERSSGDPGSPSSDLYSVGCLLWELLTGRPPYPGSDVEVAMQHMNAPVPQLNGTDEVTVELNRILALTLAKQPEQRYRSAVELRDDLRALSQRLTGGVSTATGQAVSAGSRNGRIALIAAAALVLVIGAGAGVAALTSGGGDETADPAPTTGATTGATDPTSGATESEGTGDPEPADPTETGSTDGQGDLPPIPADDGTVLGDYDNDGFGDLVMGDVSSTTVLTSDGTSFAPVKDLNLDTQEVLTGDFDGDGTRELLRIDDLSPSISVTPLIKGSRVTTQLSVPDVSEDQRFDIDFIAADLDGDGADDLVVATPTGPGDKAGLNLTVALNRGDGSFMDAQEAYSGDGLPWKRADWAVGDFDGDGDDELVHCRAQLYQPDPGFATMVDWDGSALAPIGEPLQIPREDEIPLTFGDVQEFGAADIDGDGRIELAGTNPSLFSVLSWVWDGTAFVDQTMYNEGDLYGPGGGIQGIWSDVNGDGKADLVTNGLDGVLVALSDGTSVTGAPTWDVKQERLYNAPVGPVFNGIE